MRLGRHLAWTSACSTLSQPSIACAVATTSAVTRKRWTASPLTARACERHTLLAASDRLLRPHGLMPIGCSSRMWNGAAEYTSWLPHAGVTGADIRACLTSGDGGSRTQVFRQRSRSVLSRRGWPRSRKAFDLIWAHRVDTCRRRHTTELTPHVPFSVLRFFYPHSHSTPGCAAKNQSCTTAKKLLVESRTNWLRCGVLRDCATQPVPGQSLSFRHEYCHSCHPSRTHSRGSR